MSATVKELGDLHRVVARVLTTQLTTTYQDEDGNDMMIASDKAVANAIVFLKNNDITADLGAASGLANVKNAMDELRAKRRGLLKTKPEDDDGARNTA